MPLNINKLTLAGNLVADTELADINGTPLAKFTIAYNYKKGKGDDQSDAVEYYNCELWGNGAKVFAEYTQKGSNVYLEGRLKVESWEKDDKKGINVTCVVDDFKFNSPAPKKD